MDQSNTVYAISGRIKNILASADIALTPVGTILINSYTHVLKSLYDFSDTLPKSDGDKLHALLLSHESMPKSIISLSLPKEGATLYDDVSRMLPMYPSNEAALEDMIAEYEYCGGEEFWVESESSFLEREDYARIRTLRRGIQMCQYLINKNKARALSDQSVQTEQNVPLIEHIEDNE